MRSLHVSLTAAVVICGLATTAQADCVKVGALGEAATHDIAELFSTHGLANVIYGKGREGRGPVHTTCETGSSTTTCRSWQMACTVSTPKTCFGAWFCLPM